MNPTQIEPNSCDVLIGKRILHQFGTTAPKGRPRGHMHEVTVFFFAIASGLAVSGIVANIYKIVARSAKQLPETTLHWIIMVLAGPIILFENASQSLLAKKCSLPGFCLAIALSLYWSFALGLFVLSIYLAI